MSGEKDDDLKTPVNAPEPEKEPDIDLDDVDAQDYAEAQAAVKAEESGDGNDAEPEPEVPEKPETDGGEPAPKEEGKEKAEEPKPEPERIPKARFDDVNNKRSEAEREAAYWRGQAEAKTMQQAAPQPKPEPKEPTPEEKIADIRTQRAELAKKFDEGEITAADWEAKRAELEDQEWGIRQETLKPAPQEPAKPAPAAPPTDLVLEERTAELAKAHPYVELVGGEDFDFLVKRAASELVEKGVLPEKGQASAFQTLQLRTRIAELSDQFGPMMTGKSPEEVGLVKTPTQEPPADGLSPEAKARKAKLEQAADMPPDIASMAGSSGDGELTPEKVAEMSEDEYAALPQSSINKLLGIT